MAVIAAASVALAGCASSDRQPLGSPTTWAVVLAQEYGVTMHARVIDAAGVVSNVRALPTMSALTVEEWKSLGQTRAVRPLGGQARYPRAQARAGRWRWLPVPDEAEVPGRVDLPTLLRWRSAWV